MNDKQIIYILSMERYGNREGHHYNVGLYSKLEDAVIDGLTHEQYRAGKYEMRIELAKVDSPEIVHDLHREVCINYAVMKYPENFDDRKQLKDE